MKQSACLYFKVDHETFGIHKKEKKGIFDFLKVLPSATLTDEKFQFRTPTKSLEEYYPHGVYDAPLTISGKDRIEAAYVVSENARENSTIKKIQS